MTQKEIEKFLANTKVYVAGKSKEIQEKLFSLGYEWNEGNTDVKFTDYPFLYINNNHHILYGSDMGVFSKHKYREISFEEILFIQITELTYRPFKDKDECWAEMQKHQPFGWVMDNDSTERHLIITLSEGSVYTYYAGWDFEKCIEIITFADGTPFGIKEDE